MTLVDIHISGVGIDALNLIAKKKVTNTISIASSLLAFLRLFLLMDLGPNLETLFNFEIYLKLKRLNFQWWGFSISK
jgi:hypothetical protein